MPARLVVAVALVASGACAAAAAAAAADVRIPSAAPPATFTWTGMSATGASWSDPANWNPAGPPGAGAALVFPEGAARRDNDDDLASGTAFSSITVSGAGYRLAGNAVTMAAGVTIDGPAPSRTTIDFASTPVRLARYNAKLRGTAASDHDTLVTTQALDVSGAQLDLTLLAGFVPRDGTRYTIVQAASVAGQFAQGTRVTTPDGYRFAILYNATDVTLQRLPILRTWTGLGADDRWTTPHNWTGDAPPLVGDAVLFPAGAARPGSTNDLPEGTEMHGLQFAGGPFVLDGNALSITRGVLDTSADANVVNTIAFPLAMPAGGAMSIGNDVAKLVVSRAGIPAGATMILDGVSAMEAGTITGPGTLQKINNDIVSITGDNSASDAVLRIDGGAIALAHDLALGSAAGGIATTVSPGGTLLLQGSGRRVSRPVTVSGGGGAILGAIATSGCGAGCAMAGAITLAGDATVRVDESRLVLEGPLVESGGARGLTFAGAGTLVVSGAGHCTGGTVVQGGTLLVDGSLDGAVAFGGLPGVVGGAGSIQRIAGDASTVAHVIAPGGAAGTTAILTAATAGLSPSTTLRIDIGGPAPGSGHDQLRVTGALSLAGATLDVQLADRFRPLPQARYTIATAGSVSGQFAQGSSVVAGGIPFAIAYEPDRVVLVATGPPVGARILDVDGDGLYDALTDGLMVVRFLFGLPAAQVAAAATAPGATRDADAILAHLQDYAAYLDIDGNGSLDALTDGILVLRSLFGLAGDALVHDAIGAGATRTAAPEVSAWLSTLKP